MVLMLCFSNCVKVGATMILLGWGFNYPKSNHCTMKSYGAMKRNRIFHFAKRLSFFFFSTPILPCPSLPVFSQSHVEHLASRLSGWPPLALQCAKEAILATERMPHSEVPGDAGCECGNVGRSCMDQRHNIST